MNNVDFKSLIASAERAKQDQTVIEWDVCDIIDSIIAQLKLIEQNPDCYFSKAVRRSIIDSMPWDIPFFNELMNFLGEHDKYHKALAKLKKKEIK